jgi:hypothetical protein
MPDKIDPVLAWKFVEKLLRAKDLETLDDGCRPSGRANTVN